MAKRKTPKAEKVINLTPKPEKITDQELNKLQSTVKTIDHITVDIGNMEIKKYALVKALESVQNDIQEMRNDFIKEYGTDNINIQDGTISYPPENPNPEGNGEADKKD
jgi:hypothetical protein